MATLRSLLWLLSAILVIGPPYLFEAIAEHFYLIHSDLFFFFSGQRFYFDVYYLAFAGAILGYKSRYLIRAWLIYLISVSILIGLFFAICEPILCYSTGVDGLGPVRMGSFFAAEGISMVYLGAARSGFKPSYGWMKLVAGGCAFYSIAYVPVIFTLAGATIFPQGEGLAFPAFLSFLGLTVVIGFAERSRPWTLLLPVIAMGVLLLLGSGIGRQYSSEIFPSTAASIIATAFGAATGAIVLLRSKKFSMRFKRSRLPIAGAIVFVILVTLVVWPDAVVGQVVSASNSGSPRTYSYELPETAGGFMSSPMVHPKGVGVNVTFASYDLAAVPKAGFLSGGLGVHSADCCTDGIDYGYRFDVMVYGNGSQVLSAAAWKVCDANAACGGPTWKLLMYFVSHSLPQSMLGKSLLLSMQWEDHTVVWVYRLDGETHQLGSFAAPVRENQDFNAGWLGPPDSPSLGGAFFFQFGVSKVGQTTGRWAISFDCPAILVNGSWNCISHAETLEGDQSYWKVLWRWGENFPGVAAQLESTPYSVTFHNSNSTMGSFTSLW
jgi:hypothetical protein